VVDDDVSIRELIAHELARTGYLVDSAEDGAAAWNALQLRAYDLLVTDHNMPMVSGLDLVKKLRSAGMALPVILISGMIPSEELKRNPSLQLAATLSKPFSDDELLGKVKQALNGAGSVPVTFDSEPMRMSQR
jgi:DNA-binding response OmpR family regulator